MYKEAPDQLRKQLADSEIRYKELQEKGAAALSEYDIKIASMGDAEAALRTAVMLVGNHIIYYKRKLEELKEQLRLF